MAKPHFLIVSFPAQGHLNPALQFAKRLLDLGARVTFATTVFAHGRMSKNKLLADGLSFVTFSDGQDDGNRPGDIQRYMKRFKRNGSRTIDDVIVASENENMPIACICHTPLLLWAAEVAREHNIPSAFLWIQPAAVFDVYYHYFNGYADLIDEKCCDKLPSIELPGLPPLSGRDLPSFLVPKDFEKYPFILPGFREQIEALKADTNPIILLNTFDELEQDALRAIEGLKLVAIGPLIPSAYLDGNPNHPSDTTFRGDLFECSKDYFPWLNSKPESSVVYVSFGSIAELSSKQMEDIGRALVDSGYPFLWVIRTKLNSEEEEIKLSCMEELKKQGMIVPWCSQVQVLSHPSLGCFLTHCGWNSTLESIASGVPVVAFPQWADQCTNAMMIERAWKTGVRVSTDEEGHAESDEIKKCLDLVMQDGEESQELRKNAKKWRDLSREAVKENGSSCMNLKTFFKVVVGKD